MQLRNRSGATERDPVALGIAIAAILLFVAIGGSVLPVALNAAFAGGKAPDPTMVSALLLNIALIIFGWRRYHELTSEIGESRQAEAHARALAEIDPLTGCLNRRSIPQATEELRAQANLRGDAIAVCMIDIDNFKQINDVHGHMLGDAMLAMLAERIRGVLPQNARLARLGGDEFAVISSFDPAQRDRIDDLVSRLFEQVILPFEIEGLSLTTTLSIGIGIETEREAGDPSVEPIGKLMHRADIAMYNAKKKGKNRYYWFEPSMEDEVRFRNELETGIRQGLTQGEFVPYYEQQIDLETGELVGFEMLARWHSPKLGLVSPEIFIPIAEEIGVITELSEQLMERAFADAREWDEALTLSINISPVQLRDPWFAQKLLKRLVASNFPPQRLEIEITESCLHENIAMVRTMVTSLRNQGVQISLDDFGTGYSSLEQLRSLPFDRLKIDRSFIAELRGPHGASGIVDAIVLLSRRLEMPITAEGVEDEQILAALKHMGRMKAQGHHFGMPETCEEVRARLGKADLLAKPFPTAVMPAAVAQDDLRRSSQN